MAETDMGRKRPADTIDAMPTKGFFVDMLTKDIPLEQAVLDLVDNSVDGATRVSRSGADYEGRKIRLRIGAKLFVIWDNCGGFGTEAARDYAFKFGRVKSAPRLSGSIGQFGIGMKRALFKFGRHFVVRSTTADERWSIDVDVDEWEDNDNWRFEWHKRENLPLDHVHTRGTSIRVDALRAEVAYRFSTDLFRSTVFQMIKAKHRQFIARGLAVSLNGRHIDATDLYLSYRDDLAPGYDEIKIDGGDDAGVLVRITVGIGTSSPRECGWYVICNGRVVLESDRSPKTGWGLVEDKVQILPAYHNQFARFRGLVAFDSTDSSRVPWNTTKDDVDQDSPVWSRAFRRMVEMMRPVVDFLYELDRDVDTYTKENSALYQHVTKAQQARSESFVVKRDFQAPRRDAVLSGPRLVKIQYAKPIDEIEFLQDQLDVTSAKAVGEKTFELTLKRQRR